MLKINNSNSINLINGTGKNIPEKKYDFLLININRNTIVEEFKYFLKVVKNESLLILSGFLYSDVNYISNFLKKSGLKILMLRLLFQQVELGLQVETSHLKPLGRFLIKK